jgi:DNA-binding transcriptional LysR family regulator
MAKKQPTRERASKSHEASAAYMESALAELNLVSTIDSNTSFRLLERPLKDLVLLRKFYQDIRNREGTITALMRKFALSRDRAYGLLGLLPVPVGRNGKRDFDRVQKAEHPAELPEVVFHEGLCAWLEDFAELARRTGRGGKILRVRGSEFAVHYLFPKALGHSKFLDKHTDVEMDISRSGWREMLQDVARGRAELGIGPEVRKEHLSKLIVKPVLRMQRALIFAPEHYPDLAARAPGEITLSELRYHKVFVLSGDAVPTFPMRRLLPAPEPPGRWIYVDSISHMYAFAKEGLGLALGYEKKFGRDDPGKGVKAVELQDPLPPAVICLYYSENVDDRPEVNDLIQAVEDYAVSRS